jgi:sRNA-binding regulator protein Hfq
LDVGNRRTTRPSFTDVKDTKEPPRIRAKKPTPPDQTNAENFYYIKQMQAKTPMVIVLKDGEILNGIIEWYDKASLKVNRTEGPNLLIYKTNIKYMYKANGN